MGPVTIAEVHSGNQVVPLLRGFLFFFLFSLNQYLDVSRQMVVWIQSLKCVCVLFSFFFVCVHFFALDGSSKPRRFANSPSSSCVEFKFGSGSTGNKGKVNIAAFIVDHKHTFTHVC
jgi:hypothetical protein